MKKELLVGNDFNAFISILLIVLLIFCDTILWYGLVCLSFVVPRHLVPTPDPSIKQSSGPAPIPTTALFSSSRPSTHWSLASSIA